MKTIMLRIRVEPEFKTQLLEAVKNEKAKSMSGLIREAVKLYLSKEGQALKQFLEKNA